MSQNEPLLELVIGAENAPRGIGKSIYAGARGGIKMVGAHAHSDCKACDAAIAKYNAGGWNFKREEHVKHLVYATDKITAVGMGYSTQTSLDFDFNKFGLYTKGGRGVMHLLPESTIVIFEVQRKLDSRKSMSPEAFDEELQAALEMQRHFGIKMIAEGHSWNRIEKRFREFADRVTEVQGCVHEYAPGDYNRNKRTSTPIRTTWKLHVFEGAGTYRRYIERKNPELDDAQYYTVEYHTFEGNIFKVVDSYAGHAHFVNGMQGGKNFDQKITEPPGHDIKAITEYCKSNSFKRAVSKKEAV